MPRNECQYCHRDWVGEDDPCPHCAAIRYLVWDWIGGKDTPTPEDYRRWSEAASGGVVERRQKRYFAEQWRNPDGSLRRVPREA